MQQQQFPGVANAPRSNARVAKAISEAIRQLQLADERADEGEPDAARCLRKASAAIAKAHGLLRSR